MLAFGTWAFLVSVGIVGVSLLLIGLILLQKNRGAGLSGAFGGVGGHSAFGTKTGDFLTWVTVGLVAVFLLLNIAGNYAFVPEKEKKKEPAQLIDAEDVTPAGTTDTTGGAQPIQIPAAGSPSPTPITPVPVSPPSTSTPPAGSTPPPVSPESSGTNTPPSSN